MHNDLKVPAIWVAALCAVGAAAVTGCGSSDAGSTQKAGSSSSNATASGTQGKKVTFIAGDKGDEFYITLDCGARQEAAKSGMSVDFQEPDQFAASSQTPIVNATAAKHPDALLIAPTDAKAMYVPIKQVADAGTKVVMVDTTLANPTMASSQVSTNDEVGGQQAAQSLAKLIGGKGKVIVINLNPGVSTTDARAKGFQDEAKKLGLTVLPQQYAGTSPEKAASIVQSTLAREGDLEGIFTTTNFAQEGAVTGLRGQKLLGKVKIVGFDSAPLQVKQLRAGEVQGLIAQQARKIGQLGIQQAVAALTGKATTKQIKVPTIALTKDNVDDPAVQSGLQVEKCS
jgi:ribose transport system substrate-binding protein